MSRIYVVSHKKGIYCTSNRMSTRSENSTDTYMSTRFEIEYTTRVLVYSSSVLV